jgi:hypothetical protein
MIDLGMRNCELIKCDSFIIIIIIIIIISGTTIQRGL